jgi:heat shock protein HtpX
MAAEVTLNLLEQQERNRRQTTMWMVAFVLFFAWIGFGGDLVMYLGSVDEKGAAHYRVPWIGIAVTTIAALVTWGSWRRGPRGVLSAAGARRITDPRSPEERQLFNVVEEMAIAGGLPLPEIYLMDDEDPNAFATGHGPETASVAVTSGLLRVLNREELQGVVAHEMAHVRNLDVRLMTTIAALVGVIVLASDAMGRFLRHGGGRALAGGGRGGRGKGGNPLIMVLLVLWIISLILAPLITRLMALAVSRNREYLADATAAELTRNPAALASALHKIESSHSPTRSITRSAAHLCIADPLGRKVNLREGRLASLFGTHPPMHIRIARLRGMAFQSAKAAGVLPAEG